MTNRDEQRRPAEEDHPRADQPVIEDNDAAAGGSWKYTDKVKNKPLLQTLRDNWYAISRTRKK